MSQGKDTVQRTIIIAAALSLVCSVIVSVAAVQLRPIQDKNKALDKKKNILMAASLYEEGAQVDEVFKQYVVPKLLNLADGSYVEGQDPNEYDQYKEAKNPSERLVLDPKVDVAGLRMIARYAVVYEVKKEGELDQVVVPIHGKGLWSTLYGFVSVDSDGNTIKGLGYYDHGETPGLGGEVDNPKWKASWNGKKINDNSGQLQIEVIKGQVDLAREDAQYQVDGLSGATITARGVSYMVQFWLGENGFKQYFDRIKKNS
ncbi:MAG: Na(+)-translocating NADH-quinone reductase subunit C [Oligoflexales bacterium]|nr:Na(+)-translocating NADH-quinone reductase subunit C [Oligoflexales bacterium]